LVVRSSRLRQLTILVVAALTTFTAPSPDDWPNPRRARRKIRVPGARRRTLSLSRRTARLGGGGRAAAPSVCRRAPGQQPHGRSRPMGESVFSQRHAGGQHLLRDFGIFAVAPLSGTRRRQSLGSRRCRALSAAGAADLRDLRADVWIAGIGLYP